MATAATESSSWADLITELLLKIAASDGLSLRDYTCLRGVCARWRSPLLPPYPCFLSLHDSAGRASVFSLPIQHSLHLHQHLYECVDGPARVFGPAGNVGARVVGSGNVRCAVRWWRESMLLFDPRAREEMKVLPPAPRVQITRSMDSFDCVHKVVFAPDPDDGTVVAICDRFRVAYIDTARRTNDMVWKTVDVTAARPYNLVDLVFDAAGGKVYCLDSNGGVHVLRIPRSSQDVPSRTLLSAPFSTAFAQPYGMASKITRTKHLFFCDGSLYQVWQNNCCTVRLRSSFTMAQDEILVLRHHDPGRPGWPCWDAVKDLGGCSVFIGQNSSPAVVRAGALPGVRGDCVYWIDWRRKPMVCDVATGTSKPCVLPYGTCKADCWYFGDDDMFNKHSAILSK